MNTRDSINARLKVAVDIAEEAGSLTLDFFQSDRYDVQRKKDDSPVTQADLKAEELMRKRIEEHFPNDGVLGEEMETRAGESGFQWILDPIDGTKSFITGVPLYSQLVGIVHEGESVAGVIHVPGLGESVFAARGSGAWWKRPGHEPIGARVSADRRLSDGVFVASQVDSFADRSADEAFRRLQDLAYITRTWGDGYGYMLVATGRADVMVDPIMSIWDAAAIKPILEEAGGAFTDWNGVPRIDGGEGVGASQIALEEVLAITRQFPKPA